MPIARRRARSPDFALAARRNGSNASGLEEWDGSRARFHTHTDKNPRTGRRSSRELWHRSREQVHLSVRFSRRLPDSEAVWDEPLARTGYFYRRPVSKIPALAPRVWKHPER